MLSESGILRPDRLEPGRRQSTSRDVSGTAAEHNDTDLSDTDLAEVLRALQRLPPNLRAEIRKALTDPPKI